MEIARQASLGPGGRAAGRKPVGIRKLESRAAQRFSPVAGAATAGRPWIPERPGRTIQRTTKIASTMNGSQGASATAMNIKVLPN